MSAIKNRIIPGAIECPFLIRFLLAEYRVDSLFSISLFFVGGRSRVVRVSVESVAPVRSLILINPLQAHAYGDSSKHTIAKVLREKIRRYEFQEEH